MHQDKESTKKKWLLPVLVFAVGCLILAVILYHSYKANQKQIRMITELNATTYADRLQNDMSRGVEITDTLKEILISENGKINNFSKVAEHLMTDSIQSIQIKRTLLLGDLPL